MWLDGELALPRDANGSWTFSGSAADCGAAACQVAVQALPERRLGSVALPRTSVEIEGDEAACEEFLRLFTLRFVSAGG